MEHIKQIFAIKIMAALCDHLGMYVIVCYFIWLFLNEMQVFVVAIMFMDNFGYLRKTTKKVYGYFFLYFLL